METTNVSWQTCVTEYLRDVQYRCEDKTLTFCRCQLSGLSKWAQDKEISIIDFKASDMKDYLIMRKNIGRSQRTRHHDAAVACRFFGFCAKEGLLANDPLYRYKVPAMGKASVSVPTLDDLQKFFRAIKDCWDAEKCEGAKSYRPAQRRFYCCRDTAIFACLVACGARAGEVLGLRRDDYNKEGRCLIFRSTKTDEPRTVPISESCITAVEAWLEVRPKCEVDFLFPSHFGKCLAVEQYGKRLERYRVKAGITARWTLHGLRHYAATEISKVDVLVASRILGHKNLKTTLMYLHEDAAHLREAYDKASPLEAVLVEKRTADKRREENRRKII